MENEHSHNSQKATPDDMEKITLGKTGKGNKNGKPSYSQKQSKRQKWPLLQHWGIASYVTRISWIAGAIALMAAVGSCGQGWFSTLQTKWNFEKGNRSAVSTVRVDMLDMPRVGYPVRFSIFLENTGKMDARNTWVDKNAAVAHALKFYAPPELSTIETGMTMEHGKVFQIDAQTLPITQEQADSIAKGNSCIYAFGYLS